MSNKRKNKFNPDLSTLSWISTIVGALFFTVFIIICAVSDKTQTVTGLILLIVYLLVVTLMYFVAYKIKSSNISSEMNMTDGSDALSELMKKSGVPMVITNAEGQIIWFNTELQNQFNLKGNVILSNIDIFCPARLEDILKATHPGPVPEKKNIDVLSKVKNANEADETEIIEDGTAIHIKDSTFSDEYIGGLQLFIGSNKYNVSAYEKAVRLSTQEGMEQRSYYLVTFTDITKEYELINKIQHERLVVAFIVLDNLEELAQYVRVSYRSATSEIEGILKAWATNLNGIIREYDRDKYIMLFERQELDKCIKNKFGILEKIRNIRLGDSSMPVTVSMGIAATEGTLLARENEAGTALDMALQRGGDQVALKTDNGLMFFGGKTKSIQKKTKVRARVIAEQLLSLISKASNVLVMGHKNPDFDAIGACVGIARIAMHCKVPIKIVSDFENDNFIISTAQLRECDEYSNMFVSAGRGLDYLGSQSLLIVVDVNNFAITESPELAKNSFSTVVIDHHRKVVDFDEQSMSMTYIDPSASSTCELITEVLEQCLPSDTLLKEEANMLISGIMLDTKNFTRTTGIRTFAAALYLRGEGASTEVTRTFFNERFDDYKTEIQYGMDATIYRTRIAITKTMGQNPATDRVAAARAADKLLSIRAVDAAFALVATGDVIHISARSNGIINVQLILEKLNGGGHFDMAGTQLEKVSLHEATIKLKWAIDEYLDNDI